MTRSRFQPGPATDHYHDTLGVEETPQAELGGASVLVNNGVDAPAAVTTLVAPGAVIAGDMATLLYVQLFKKTVHFDDVGLRANPGVATGWDVAVGAWITDAWVVLTTAFDSGSFLTLQTDVNGDSVMPGVPVDDVSLLEYAEGDLSQALDGEPAGPFLDARSRFIAAGVGGRVIPAKLLGGSFYVRVSNAASPLTVGEAEVYAIIATPAS
jgi:hypothetical protein